MPLTGALLLICVVNYFIGGADNIDWVQVIGQYTGLQGVVFKDYGGVFWTLAYEIWFYILLLAALMVFRLKQYVGGGILLALASAVWANLQSPWLLVIVLGIVCFSLKDVKLSARRLTGIKVMIVPLFVVYYVCSTHLLYSLIAGQISDMTLEKLRYASQILLFAAIAVVLSQHVNTPPQQPAGKLIHTWTKGLASFSYSLFLTHFQVLKLWEHYMPKMNEISVRSMGYFLAVCGCCIVVAWIFYRLFEKNTAKVQRTLERWLKIV